MVKADLEQGISKVQNAHDTLRDHYEASFVQQSAAPEVYLGSGGAGSSIVGKYHGEALKHYETIPGRNKDVICCPELHGEKNFLDLVIVLGIRVGVFCC